MRLKSECGIEDFSDSYLSSDSFAKIGNRRSRSGIVAADCSPGAYCLSGWRCIMHPVKVGLIGLAVAVALWGFAYKLSLYYSDQNRPAPISVAKLWLGPEGTLLISKNRPKCQVQQRWSLDSVLARQVETPPEAHSRTLAIPDAAVFGRGRSSDWAPRSPPPYMS
jgi:hypothetical protein